jgi:hypothetical protein
MDMFKVPLVHLHGCSIVTVLWDVPLKRIEKRGFLSAFSRFLSHVCEVSKEKDKTDNEGWSLQAPVHPRRKGFKPATSIPNFYIYARSKSIFKSVSIRQKFLTSHSLTIFT